MSFVNEFVSEADIQHYKLDEMMRELHGSVWRAGRPSTFRHSWTINREDQVFFIRVRVIEESGPSGRPEPTPMRSCVLFWRGHHVKLTMNQHSWKSELTGGWRVAWELLRMELPAAAAVTSQEVVQSLKAALAVYGLLGVYSHTENVQVEFTARRDAIAA